MSVTTGLGDIPGRRRTHFDISASLAATATDETTIALGVKAQVFKCVVYPGAALSGADTNTNHLNFDAPDGTEVGTVDFVSGTDAVLGTAIEIYNSTTGVAVTAAQTVSIEREKVGTGIITPSFSGYIEWEPR